MEGAVEAMSDRRVWIGCLGHYNNGELLGKWIDSDEVEDITPEDIHDGPTTHEELWVMDSDGYGNLLTDECNPIYVADLENVLQSLERKRYEIEAYAGFCDNNGSEPADFGTLSRFEEAFCGEYASREDFAQTYADDLGLLRQEGWPYDHIDWESAARDLFMDYFDAPAPGGYIYVYRSL